MIGICGFSKEGRKAVQRELAASDDIFQKQGWGFEFARDGQTIFAKKGGINCLIVPPGTTVWSHNKDKKALIKGYSTKLAVIQVGENERLYVPSEVYLFNFGEEDMKVEEISKINRNEATEVYPEIGVELDADGNKKLRILPARHLYPVDTGKPNKN